MTGYSIITTDEFEKEFSKLDKAIQTRFNKQFARLETEPYSIGKPITGASWFRELKNLKYRVYYLVYDDQVLVLLAGISYKKDQQSTINNISNELGELHELVINRKY